MQNMQVPFEMALGEYCQMWARVATFEWLLRLSTDWTEKHYRLSWTDNIHSRIVYVNYRNKKIDKVFLFYVYI